MTLTPASAVLFLLLISKGWHVKMLNLDGKHGEHTGIGMIDVYKNKLNNSLGVFESCFVHSFSELTLHINY